MAFQPITYAGQYPPLKPRSSSDVSSFAAMHSSLRRSLPELAREGDRILNEEMLARFVDGVARFQREHLGRKSKSRYWPALRLPSPLLSDRKTYPNGPLGVMVLSAFRIKQVSAWRNFNFDNPKLFDDNVSMIKRMESDLIDRGYLRRPVVYFDSSVERGLGKDELRRLIKIALRFGAKVEQEEGSVRSGRVTHVVAYDPEEHDADDVIAEERERERRNDAANRAGGGGGGGHEDDEDGGDGGGGDSSYPSEKKFLRTLAVVDAPASDDEDENEDDDDGTPGSRSGRRRTTRRMALVHWWYHPSSYDEWLPADEVSGAIEGEVNHGVLPNGGQCVVGCKFVRDVERFNEWGVEADYAVMEYERKVDCLRPRGSGEEVATAKKSGVGGKRASSAADDDDDDDDDDEGDGAAKRRRTGKDGADVDVDVGTGDSSSSVAAPSSSSRKSKSKNSGGQIKASPGAGGAGGGNHRRPTSERRGGGGGGMNPRGILTGLRGPRGEVVRRTVHDGALRVEDGANAVIRDALADYLLGNASGGKNATTTTPTPTLAARPEWRKLLPATGFVRPSVDASLGRMIVTELTLAEEGGSSSTFDDAADVGATKPTLAVNRAVPVLIPSEETADAVNAVAAGCGGEEPMTMRGGGSEEDSGGDQTWQRQQEMAEMVNDAVPAADGESHKVEVVQPPEEQHPAVEGSGTLDAATEDADDFGMAGGEGVVDTSSIADPCENPTAELEEDAMQVEEEVAAATAPEEIIREDVVTIQAEEQLPKEMPASEDVVDTTDATDAGEDIPAELQKDAMQLEGNPAFLSLAESAQEKLGAPTNDEPPEELPTGAHQEIDSPPPVADDGVPYAGADGEPLAPSTETKLMEVDLPAAVVAEAAPEAMEASTVETTPDAIAPLEQGRAATKDVTSIVVADKQPSDAIPTAATEITTALSHPAAATVDSIVASNIVAQVSSSIALTAVAPVTAEETPSKTMVAATESSNSAAQADSTKSSSDSIVLCQVVSLPPNTHLSNTLIHNPQSNEGDSKNGPDRPSWYHPTKPSEFEKRLLPEWFNCTAPHRTEFTYIATRENILSLAKRNTQQFITTTAIRRSVAGDAGSLLRLHKFLMDFGLLNGGQIGETAPGDAVLRGLHTAGGSFAGSKRKHSSAMAWTSDRIHSLEVSIVKYVSKKTVGGSPDQVNLVVDWEAVASDVGGGATASDCQSAFINPPAEEVKIAISSNNSVFSHILDGVHPDVLKAVVQTSLQATNDIKEARKASFVAVMASAAAQNGAQTESEIENTLMDIVDQRLQRLENRVALLDDVEALLEAERVSLELERRDMYTARCRHWFGDGSS